ncbi:hypothetical protein [Agaribacter marinus]|uniref:Uncharacterized protein n=1 Tax=Agaribacter marinus TaxID=1431249 RepID=A0AA37WGD3_9ALTE|nr:hypothetical protein [Agaribacter marinus]GLR70051.1 hypothetical protein GCM10007852_09590 [Agaribacter marinus]
MLSRLFESDVNDTLNAMQECRLINEQCAIESDYGKISVNFMQPPISEEELALQFSIPAGYALGTVQIEGINMYMGKTPVLFEDTRRPALGVTFLGACNLDEMQWKMTFKLTKNGTILAPLYTVYFSTTK